MAIYHLCVKTVSRSAGRSATAAAAYRAGVEIADARTGDVHNYTRKAGVESAAMIVPTGAPEWASNRAALWNAAEQAEVRKNSTVAREFEIALPSELSPLERKRLAHDFAREIVERHGCAADVALHAPSKKGNSSNHHAHILLTTRRLTPEGLGEKTRELDDMKTGPQIVTQWRTRFAELQNERLRENGVKAHVDSRSLKEQGVKREPTRHLGPAAIGFERRTGTPSRLRLHFEAEVVDRLAKAKRAGELERLADRAGTGAPSLLDVSGDLAAAQAARSQKLQQKAEQGMRQFEQRFAQWEAEKAEQARQKAQQERKEQERQRQEQQAQERARQAAEKKVEPPARVAPKPKRDFGQSR
jgi:ATP-dependent exoDNAse (exonuclease V) alpha subunit